MKALVSIGDFDFPEPSAYSGTTSTLVDSGRNTDGYMVGAVIRDDVGKVELEWNFLTIEQWRDILQMFSIKNGGSFTNRVTFFCQDSADWETREMYVNDRTASVFRRDPATGEIIGYKNPKLSLIEV